MDATVGGMRQKRINYQVQLIIYELRVSIIDTLFASKNPHRHPPAHHQPAPTPTSWATKSSAALSGGNNRATARSLNVCPYRATSVLLRRPQVLGFIEATSIVTRGGCSLRGMRPCHHGRRTLAVTQAAGKQPFTAPNCDGPDLVSDPVIVDGHSTPSALNTASTGSE